MINPQQSKSAYVLRVAQAAEQLNRFLNVHYTTHTPRGGVVLCTHYTAVNRAEKAWLPTTSAAAVSSESTSIR
jgi:hypothetical protein